MKIKIAKFKCPRCGAEEDIEIPKDVCLTFHECKSRNEAVTTPENFCCVICAYSDRKCGISAKKH